MDMINNLGSFFTDVLQKLRCEEDTRAYIISVFSKYRNSTFDLSQESITLAYARASFHQDFLGFQTIGDWLFFANTLFPESLSKTSKGYYHNLARLSYYSCYRLINRQWVLFERLADDFVPLSEATRQTFKRI